MTPAYIVWNVSPDLLHVGFLTVRWYGLMFVLGFWIGFNILARMFRREGAPESWLSTLLIYVVVATLVGARLGHVFFYEWSYYSQHPWDIVKIWEGGLASHGGTIAIIIAVIIYSMVTTRRSPLWTFDRLVIPIALTGALIRMGNLFNSEIFGHATDLPWGFMFVRSSQWHALYEGVPVHPTQIYEALCYLALFGLLMWLYWKRNAGERPGLLLGIFFVGIFLPRFLIEFVKNPQAGFEVGMTLNMGQWLSIPFVIAGLWLIVRAMLRPRLVLEYPDKFADESGTRNHQSKTTGKR